jgi:hypothetical protein
MTENKIEKIVRVYSRISGNLLARFAINVDPELSKTLQDKMIVQGIVDRLDYEVESCDCEPFQSCERCRK